MSIDVSIVMRSHNDESIIGATLDAVMTQRGITHEIVHVDNASTDRTLDIIQRKNPTGTIVSIPEGAYVPGKALNAGVAKARGTVIVFLNSDAVPDNCHWLSRLIEPLSDQVVGAVYGRQLPHHDARPVVVRDHLSAYPPGDARPGGFLPNESWTAFFSMANCAVRKDVIEQIPVPEDVQFSEDIKWAQHLREREFQTPYIADAVVRHSHNYSYSQAWRRFVGEGQADAAIFGRRPVRDSFALAVVVPVLASVVRDFSYLATQSSLSVNELGYSVRLRFAQHAGRYTGLKRSQA